MQNMWDMILKRRELEKYRKWNMIFEHQNARIKKVVFERSSL